MKKNYLFILAIFATLFSTNAQIIDDDFESYTLGDMGDQNPSIWSTWSGDPTDGSGITVVELTGGNQAGYIGPDSVQDALFLLGNLTAGDYFLDFRMFITSGSTAYFNIQGETETNVGTGYEGAGAGGTGVFNSGNLYFNQGGANPGVFVDEATGETGIYPEEEWFDVHMYFDVDNATYTITIDGLVIHAIPVPFQADITLGAIDFFSIDANNNYWIDDMLYYSEIFIGKDDFSVDNFKVFPNPVEVNLSVQSSTPIDVLEIYDVAGKLILKTTPNAISPIIDMSPFNSGVYLVKVSIDGASKTVKIIK